MAQFSIKQYIQAFVDYYARYDRNFDYTYTEVSGVNGLEGILSGAVQFDNFMATDSTGDGYIVMNPNGGYFIRRVATVFVVRKYEYGNMADQLEQVQQCRLWFKRILRQMVKDQDDLNNKLIYLNTDRVAFRELAPEMAEHFTGLYFMLEFSQPYDVLND